MSVPPAPAGTTYDTGVLVGAERRASRVAVLHRHLTERGVIPSVPAPVLAQAWRGGPQAELSRLLRGCKVVETTEDEARRAGAALGRSGTDDVVDAVVVVGALDRRESVITGDPDDLEAVAAAIGRRLVVTSI